VGDAFAQPRRSAAGQSQPGGRVARPLQHEAVLPQACRDLLQVAQIFFQPTPGSTLLQSTCPSCMEAKRHRHCPFCLTPAMFFAWT
jgi:hypothetical protein